MTAPPDTPGRDTVYADSAPGATGDLVDFAFDARVAAVFPDMIRRSVPGYAEVVALTGVIAARHAQPGSRLYDLGASLGASSLAMRRQVRAPGVRIIAVDNAPAMLEQARGHIAASGIDGPDVELVCADLRDVEVSDASVVVLNWVMQFLPPAERLAVLKRIRAGLRPGGVLLLAEKVRGDTAEEHAWLDAAHLDFKRANGYSELEISAKRTALERVMQPDSAAEHHQRLAAAGFSRSAEWFRALNFRAFVAHV